MVFVNYGTKFLSNNMTEEIALCDHEEAYTKLVVHIDEAINNGHRTCLVHTVDTDGVILIGKFSHFITLNSAVDIWVAFGSGKNPSFVHY